MSSALRATRREGPEPPLTRPTLAMTHPELGSLGTEIIENIMHITHEGQRSANSVIDIILELLDKVLKFVEDTLSSRGLNDNVVYWSEQTYEIVRRLERKVISMSILPPLSTATIATTAVRI